MPIFYILADLTVVCFFVMEQFLRFDKAAKKVTKTKYEKGSTDWTGAAIVISSLLVFLSPLPNHFKFLNFNPKLLAGIIGLVLAVGGIAVRTVGMRTLGRFYTRTLQEKDGHQLVTDGIYRVIRHPGYAGTVLIFIGAGLVGGNLLFFILITALILIIYLYRIHVEEQMLVRIFGDEYRLYQKRSKRIVPYIF